MNRLFGVLRKVVEFVGECSVLFVSSIRALLSGKVRRSLLIQQMEAVGVGAIPIVAATALSTGAVVALYTVGVFVRYGASNLVGGTLTYTFLNELGPVLAGVAVASRSGAAISAEIGSMVVTEQVDALRALAVSPVHYLVAPRFIACLLMMPILCLISDVVGIAGSYGVSVSQGVPLQAFLESARLFVTEQDLISGMIKTVVFGALISIVACRQGLATRGGAVGVGRATTSSVVICVVLVFVSDYFLANILRRVWGS